MDDRKRLLMLMVLCMVQLIAVETRSFPNEAANPIDINESKNRSPRALHYHTKLHVAPFPYLPDSVGDNYRSLHRFIIDAFELAHPGIELSLRPMSMKGESFYNMTFISGWLSPDGSEYDVVEIDTVILGDLVSAGLVAPQIYHDSVSVDWHPAAAAAVRINQAQYAYPHLMCAFFLFTRDNEVARASTIDQLDGALRKSASKGLHIVGNLDSSWDLPALFIDSYADTGINRPEGEAFALHNFQNNSFESLFKLARLCDQNGNLNYCLDGTFAKNPDVPAMMFGGDHVQSMFGYSERLFKVLSHSDSTNKHNIRISPLPLGTDRNEPVFFTDAFVFRRNMPPNKLAAARAFVQFMASLDMQVALLASADSSDPNPVPRYLLPMLNSAYNHPLLMKDYYYQTFFRTLTKGAPFPNTGFLNTRQELRAAILKKIKI